MKKQSVQEIKAMADEVRILSLNEVKALPNMLGRIASSMVAANGFYTYNETHTGKKIFIELKKGADHV